MTTCYAFRAFSPTCYLSFYRSERIASHWSQPESERMSRVTEKLRISRLLKALLSRLAEKPVDSGTERF